ncbi:MAG: ABC transporter permease [Candidatus Krumholzibacteriota bacterium]|nr:ABC transporter permease [Candidatus Krumholzibacteriota bacterium]
MKRIVVNIGYLLSLLWGFLGDMRAQKKRSILTIFGIFWGTAAVILMMSVGTAVRRQNIVNFKGLGDYVIIVFPGVTTKPFEGFGVDRRIQLVRSDADLLRREVPEIVRVSEEYMNWRSYLRRGARTRNPLVAGVNVEFGEMRNIIPRPGGRYFNDRDQEERRRVVFIGDKLKEFLYDENEPVEGTFLTIDGVPFRVIGVLEHKTQDSSYGSRDQDRAFIPSMTFEAMFGHRYLNNLIVQHSLGTSESGRAVRRIREVLGKAHVFDPDDESALGIWDTAVFYDEFMLFFTGFNIFLLVMGAATLGVGGLGVSNIMYVVVRERTREIGVKRAVGARRRTILAQFLAETFFIIGIGAVLGFLFAWGVVAALGAIPEGAAEVIGVPRIDGLVAVVAIGVIMLVGFLAGLFPALRAARLDPVRCLGY